MTAPYDPRKGDMAWPYPELKGEIIDIRGDELQIEWADLKDRDDIPPEQRTSWLHKSLLTGEWIRRSGWSGRQ